MTIPSGRMCGWLIGLAGGCIALGGLAFVKSNVNLQAVLVGVGCGVVGIGLASLVDSYVGSTADVLQRLTDLTQVTNSITQVSEDLSATTAGLSDALAQSQMRTGALQHIVEDLGLRVTGLAESIPLLHTAGELGIRLFHRTRTEAVEALLRDYFLEEPRQVVVVGSTIRGLYQNDRVRERIQNAVVRHHADYRFLLTHWDFVSRRQVQENRPRGAIAIELRETLLWLINKCGLPLTSIRLYYGTPTCFMITSGAQMLLNPYTYECVAFGSFCLEVENTRPDLPQGQEGTVWHQYYVHHFYRPWYGTREASDVRCNSMALPSDWEEQLLRWIAEEQGSLKLPRNFPPPASAPPLDYL